MNIKSLQKLRDLDGNLVLILMLAHSRGVEFEIETGLQSVKMRLAKVRNGEARVVKSRHTSGHAVNIKTSDLKKATRGILKAASDLSLVIQHGSDIDDDGETDDSALDDHHFQIPEGSKRGAAKSAMDAGVKRRNLTEKTDAN